MLAFNPRWEGVPWVCEININIIRITNTFPIREFFHTSQKVIGLKKIFLWVQD